MAGVALVLGMAGCSQSRGPAVYPVAGRVTVNGQPASAALITLHPEAGDASRPVGRAGPDGAFALTTRTGGDGAPAGTYRVTVDWAVPLTRGRTFAEGDTIPVRRPLPAAYGRAETTPLRATVRPGVNEPLTIEIKTNRR
jgi:hypothetical protein